MSEVRIGLVGCGGIGGVHARSWAQVEGARIVAAADVDRTRAAATGGTPYADYTAMLDAEALDLVDICTPPKWHAPAAIAALERGRRVLCEKPLARNPDEARAIVAAAEQSGTLLMTAFCHRFHPPIVWLKSLIESGKLGRVVQYRNRFGAKFEGIESVWFSNPDIAGGGVLMDTSVHSVDLFRHLVGEVVGAASATHTFHAHVHGLEDTGTMLLTAEGGAIGVIEASWVTPHSKNIVEVYGEAGAAVVDYNTGTASWCPYGESTWQQTELPDENRFVLELRHVAAVVRGEATPRVTGHDGMRAVEIIHQAYANRL